MHTWCLTVILSILTCCNTLWIFKDDKKKLGSLLFIKIFDALELQPVEGQCLSIDCLPQFHLSADRGEISSPTLGATCGNHIDPPLSSHYWLSRSLLGVNWLIIVTTTLVGPWTASDSSANHLFPMKFSEPFHISLHEIHPPHLWSTLFSFYSFYFIYHY